MKYLKRCVDELLERKLNSSGAVLIKGPKWCGKSTTASIFAKSSVYLQSRIEKEQNIELARNAPDLFLKGETPRLIDEWQEIPFIWDDIRYEIDKRDKIGQFILTGSASPIKGKEKIRHSGLGRISTLIMRPMSLYESLDSNGSVSLKSLFDKEKFTPSTCSLTLEDYTYLACRGGWPKQVGQSKKVSLDISSNYFEELIENDVASFNIKNKTKSLVKVFLRSFARNISTQASLQTIKEDMQAYSNIRISDEMMNTFVSLFEDIFVIDNIEAFSPVLRSKTTIRTSATKHFVDPSIACRALNCYQEDLINDLKTFGFIFEDMVVRDLKVYSSVLNGKVYHYRDKNGLEVDAIIHLDNGQWAAVEVKLNDIERIEQGAQHLINFSNSIDSTKMKKPDFLMIVTASKYAYRRDDGVYVVPLGCLKD